MRRPASAVRQSDNGWVGLTFLLLRERDEAIPTDDFVLGEHDVDAILARPFDGSVFSRAKT
jgi:hypothetical protein